MTSPCLARRACRVLGNLASALGLMLALPFTLLTLADRFRLWGVALGITLLVALASRERAGPGHSLAWSLRRFTTEPLVRANPRLAIVPVALVALVSASLVEAIVPRLSSPLGVEGLEVVDLPLGEGAGGVTLRPYTLSWNADTRHLLVTHAHGAGGGVTLVDLSGPPAAPPTVRHFVDDDPHGHYATEIARDSRVVLHVGQESVPHTVLFQLDEHKRSDRREPRFGVLHRSTYDPRDDTLYLADFKGALHAVARDDFVAGRFDSLRTWPLPSIQSPAQVLLDPLQARRVFVRGEYGFCIVMLDTETGRRARLILPLVTQGMAVDPDRERLYVAEPFSGRLAVIAFDEDLHLELVERVHVGGWLREVAYLPAQRAIAVASFWGGRLVLLDADTFEPRRRIPTCSQARSVVFDAERSDLYFGDRCGLHRVHLPPPTRRQGSEARVVPSQRPNRLHPEH